MQSASVELLLSWHKVCIGKTHILITRDSILLFVDAVELGDYNPSTSLSLLMLPNLNMQLLSQVTEVYSQLK